MVVAAAIPIPIRCELCAGRPFVVHVPMRTEPVGGWMRVAVDSEHLRAAVRAHVRQHEN